MALQKSTTTDNFTGIQKVLIIKAIDIIDMPEGDFLNQSEIQLRTGSAFESIEITDGNYLIESDDEGHGNIYNIAGKFRHPKVRPEAKQFFSKYESKLVRLLITDNNNYTRLTPPLNITIAEGSPEMPGYNGYEIAFNYQGEVIPFITMDGNYVPPALTFADIYEENKICVFDTTKTIVFFSLKFRALLATGRKIVYEVNGVTYTITNVQFTGSTFTITPSIGKGYFKLISMENVFVEQISLPQFNSATLEYSLTLVNTLVHSSGLLVLNIECYNTETTLLEQALTWANNFDPDFGNISVVNLWSVNLPFSTNTTNLINQLVASGIDVNIDAA